MVADVLLTQGDRISGAMVLSWNILISASEVPDMCYFHFVPKGHIHKSMLVPVMACCWTDMDQVFTWTNDDDPAHEHRYTVCITRPW